MEKEVRTEILWAKVHEDAVIPTKRKEDAGYDIYPCFDDDRLIIQPQETKLVPTGIASAIGAGYYFQIEERGSVGSKGIKKSAGVIDSGFRGEWFIAITNTTKKTFIITRVKSDLEDSKLLEENIVMGYDKAIAQAVLHVVPDLPSKVVSFEELQTYTSERGAAMLGSTDD